MVPGLFRQPSKTIFSLFFPRDSISSPESEIIVFWAQNTGYPVRLVEVTGIEPATF